MNRQELATLNKSRIEELNRTLPFLTSGHYEIESLLQENKRGCTLRVRHMEENRRYLLKLRPVSELVQTKNEAQMLRLLEEHHIPAPRLKEQGAADDRCYLLREYIEGETLSECIERVGGMNEGEILGIGILLAEALRAIHSLPEPIIHRDIKPKNILLLPDDKLMLIDYDTARFYKDDASSDTMFMGTKQTAAPEQYGFAQSDVRTDIYGVGKTLIWLATGSYDEKKLTNAPYSDAFRELLLSCVQVDPDRRPADVDALQHRLEQLKKKQERFEKKRDRYPDYEHYRRAHRLRLAGAGVLVLLIISEATLLIAGWGQGLASDRTGPTENVKITDAPLHAESDIVDFGGSASMETAVRAALFRDDTEPITYGDLKKVQSLFAIGTESSSDAVSYKYVCDFDQIEEVVGGEEAYAIPATLQGDISDLSLLCEMPKLKKLYLAHQPVTNLSALKHLKLDELGLVDLAVEDYAPVAAQTGLERLVLGKLSVKDSSFLSGLKRIEYLVLSDMDIDTLKSLPDGNIGYLILDRARVRDESFGELSRLPMLWRVELWSGDQKTLDSFGDLTHLTELGLFKCTLPDGLTHTGKMPNLSYLQADHKTNLGTITGLDHFKNLKKIRCYPSTRKKIKKEYPDTGYEWEEGED